MDCQRLLMECRIEDSKGNQYSQIYPNYEIHTYEFKQVSHEFLSIIRNEEYLIFDIDIFYAYIILNFIIIIKVLIFSIKTTMNNLQSFSILQLRVSKQKLLYFLISRMTENGQALTWQSQKSLPLSVSVIDQFCNNYPQYKPLLNLSTTYRKLYGNSDNAYQSDDSGQADKAKVIRCCVNEQYEVYEMNNGTVIRTLNESNINNVLDYFNKQLISNCKQSNQDYESQINK